MEPQRTLAERTARLAHHGGTDKAGLPYIDHVERVALRLERFPEDVRTCAWLHDVCDCGTMDLDRLKAMGFEPRLVEAVDALTRRTDDDLDAYLKRVLATRPAATVKRADLTDNAKPERLELLPQAAREALEVKYAKYLAVLGSYSTSTVADLLPTPSRHAPEIAWAEHGDCDPLMVYHSFPLPLAQAALGQTADAASAEPAITATLLSLLPASGHLHGLEDRLKSPSHLAEKLRRERTAGKAAEAQDQVRYTLVLPVNTLVDLANDYFEDLRVRGWQCAELTHRYFAGAPYKGIHALLRTHGASSRVVELQVHTAEALEAKKLSRVYFEMSQGRPGTAGRLSNDEITRARVMIWEHVPTPQSLSELHFGDRRVERFR
jgi:Guanosine polyphosphate pyrophosphohydrolases/synthetases